MSTLANRSNTALLIIDVQNGVVAEAYDRDHVVANVGTLVDKARAADVDVVWVAHNGDDMPRDSAGWQYVPELKRLDSEPLVHKAYGDAFEETDLESVLAERGIGRLVVGGAQTDECIRSTLHGAITRGYDATLVSDAHATEDLSPWGAPAGQGNRPHQPLLGKSHRTRAHCRNGQHRRGRLRRELQSLSLAGTRRRARRGFVPERIAGNTLL